MSEPAARRGSRPRVSGTGVPRAPVSRPDTFATGRPERPDPCADPPTMAIRPTRVMPAVPVDEPDADLAGSTVPGLRAVEPGGVRGDHGRPGRVLGALVGATLLHQVAPLTVVLVAGPGPGVVFLVAWQVTTAADLVAAWLLRAGPPSLRRLLLAVVPALVLAAALLAVLLADRLPAVPGLGPVVPALPEGGAAAVDVLPVLVLGTVLRLVVVHALTGRRRAGRWSPVRLHLAATVPTLLAVGATVAVVVVTLRPTAVDLASPDAVRAVLLPVAAAYVVVQVACAAAVLAARRARPERP